jgi:hypothetical protein
LVGKISRSEHVLSRLKISPTWKNLSRGVHQSIDCSPEKKEWIITGFEKAWERFASDFLDVTANTEYNSVKHGLRAQLGGFTVAIGPSDSSEDGRRPESMKSLGGSKFGSSFHKIEPFPNEKLNFRGRKVARNWVPENLVDGVHLLAWSIGNVVTALRIMNRDKSTDCEIRHPQTLDLFDAPWAKCPGASSFTLDTIIKSDVIKPLSKDQILDSYLRNEEGQVADNQS